MDLTKRPNDQITQELSRWSFGRWTSPSDIRHGTLTFDHWEHSDLPECPRHSSRLTCRSGCRAIVGRLFTTDCFLGYFVICKIHFMTVIVFWTDDGHRCLSCRIFQSEQTQNMAAERVKMPIDTGYSNTKLSKNSLGNGRRTA